MTEDMNDILADDPTADGNVPQAYQEAQRLLDQFVSVGYDTVYNALRHYSHSGSDNANYLKDQIVTILRDNPPLATLPKYLRDGRENYLWYSDFYDDAGKEVFRQYGQFSAPAVKITPANYVGELNKIDLPYFAELVNLISLEKLYMGIEARMARAKSISAAGDIKAQPQEPTPGQIQPEAPAEKTGPKRSYEPKLNSEQYSLLAECIESIKLFRRPMPVAELKKLLKGKLAEPIQVANQNSLTYLFDKLGECGLIREKWIAVAVSNRDFLSFRRGKNIDRYGNEPHYISMQQFSNCRNSNRITGFKDLLPIDDAMEGIRECGGK